MTNREKYLKVMRFEPVTGGFAIGCYGGWPETEARWRQEGWDGRFLYEIFGFETLVDLPVNYGPAPLFEETVIAEDERTRLFVNHAGIQMRELKDNPQSSMPQFVRFPVETEADFEQLAAARFGVDFEKRVPDEWEKLSESWQDRADPVRCWPAQWGGFFGTLRGLMGVENLCFAFLEQPALIEKMMASRAEALIRITEKVLEHTTIDTFWLWEDMAYNHGSIIDPGLFRRFALPHYRRVCDWLRRQGIENIFLDSDGDIRELIPIWLEGGINGLWPFEVQSGMDVVEVRREYGHDLRLGGGIDKRAVAVGGETMRREVERVMPLVEDGGYVPEMDHDAPPDISWGNVCDYMEYLRLRLDRG
ncbi:MAG: uroporphyrinogen decarboxylase family protein [Lentisphaeria bacterium]|nr:uroporphyrinogen decarboxylase family protein [Lentisphaeria bacterium]